MDMPHMGFGTYGRTGAKGLEALLFALETGYRLLDTAQDYGTEENCGRAVAQSGLPREEIFVTTKVAPRNFGPGDLVPSVEQSLEVMGLSQADLTLIHWPSPNGEVPLPVYLEQLAEAQQKGLTRLIGVSNFTIAMLEEANRILGPGALTTNQVEVNVYIQNRKLLDHCQAKGLTVTCYQPIAKGRVNDDPAFCAIAEEQGLTPCQLALAFLLSQGHAVIPTSSNHGRIAENFAAAGRVLDAPVLDRLRSFDKNDRQIDPDWGPDWD